MDDKRLTPTELVEWAKLEGELRQDRLTVARSAAVLVREALDRLAEALLATAKRLRAASEAREYQPPPEGWQHPSIDQDIHRHPE